MVRLFIVAMVSVLALAARTQLRGPQNQQEIHATMKPGIGERGKCTIEVEVDLTAEVEVFGEHATIRTLAGQLSTFRRMECTGPMPLDPLDFQFKGIDARGSQTIVHDPRTNGGRALVRIEDPKNGRQGYTFELSWKNPVDPRDFGRLPGDREQEFGPRVEFTGKGDGYFRRNGVTDRLGDIDVSVRGGDIRIMFFTPSGGKIYFSGRLIHAERTRLTGEMSGSSVAQGGTSNVSGKMTIDIDHDRVKYISMSGAGSGLGRNRFDVRWHD